MKPIIGIAANRMNIKENPETNIELSYTPQAYCDTIKNAGGIPIILPISNKSDVEYYANIVDGLLLGGGKDVSPHHYKEMADQKIGALDPLRDASELALIETMVELKKPILGICRGLQILNVFFGGSLYQDLSMIDGYVQQHSQETDLHYPQQNIKIVENSILHELFGSSHFVNTYHHQAIKDVAGNFKATAYAEDGVIEAIEDRERGIIGVQWHPEFTCGNQPIENRLFDYFIDLATAMKNKGSIF